MSGGTLVFEKGVSIEELEAEGLRFQEFRKKVTTKMARVGVPFDVETSEGRLHCEDGWVAFDARGYPYPIAADEQSLIYESVCESEEKAAS